MNQEIVNDVDHCKSQVLLDDCLFDSFVIDFLKDCNVHVIILR